MRSIIVHPRPIPLVHFLHNCLHFWNNIVDMLGLDGDQKAANCWNQVNDTHLEGLVASRHLRGGSSTGSSFKK